MRVAHHRLGMCVLLYGACVPACVQDTGGVGPAATREAVIYGEDGRIEGFEETDPALRSLALRSTGAIVLRSDLRESDSGLEIDAPTFAEAFELCPEEPFAEQPTGAQCTAVLVAPDVVLTAGHCLAIVSCPRIAVVFGYHFERAGELRALTDGDIYGCAEVVQLETSDRQQGDLADYAFLRLDRAASPPWAPVLLPAGVPPLLEGQELVAIGHGGGLPLKIVHGGQVVAGPIHADAFSADIDNFAGGSGSGVFSGGELVGVAASGERDFEPSPQGDCERVRRLDTPGREQITRIERAVDGLCGSGYEAAPCDERARAALTADCAIATGPRGGTTFRGWLLALAAAAVWARRRRGTRRTYFPGVAVIAPD